MWNINIKSGCIWLVKSINELPDDSDLYEGMQYGSNYILILSAFTDVNDVKKFTYLNVRKAKIRNRTMYPITINGVTYFIELDELKTGDQRSLYQFVDKLDVTQIQTVIKLAKDYFNLHISKKQQGNSTKKVNITADTKPKERIHKFGMYILVGENEDVKLDKNKRIILSDKAKYDIINNSNTEAQIKELSYKYDILPSKAIKEIKSRLVYKYKHKK